MRLLSHEDNDIGNRQDTIKYASTRTALAGSNQRLQEGKGEKGKNKVEKGKKKGKRKKRGNEKLRKKKEKRKERKETSHPRAICGTRFPLPCFV